MKDIKTIDSLYHACTYGRARRLRARPRSPSLGRQGPRLHRLRQRHRRHEPRLCQPRMGEGRLRTGRSSSAHLEPLLQREDRHARGTPCASHALRARLSFQLRRRGQRVPDQDRPKVGFRHQGRRRASLRHARQQLPRPHAHDRHRHGAGHVPQVLRALHAGIPLRARGRPCRTRKAA